MIEVLGPNPETKPGDGDPEYAVFQIANSWYKAVKSIEFLGRRD